MGRMVDAVDPANIVTTFDGGFAVVITVLADPRGSVFDIETDNAPAAEVVQVVTARFRAGLWSVAYINEGEEVGVDTELAAAGVPLLDANRFPAPGVYLWCSDPSRNIAAGRWRPKVVPVAVQDTFAGPVDFSTTAVEWPFTVAGYLDGRVSGWPAAAWARFRGWTPPAPPPVPQRPIKEDTVIHFNDTAGNNYIAAEAADQAGHLLVFSVDPGKEDVRDVTDAATARAHANNPADTRTYTIAG